MELCEYSFKEEGRTLLSARFQQALQKSGKSIEQEYFDELLFSAGDYSDDDISMLAEYLVNYTTYENIHDTLNTFISYLKRKESIVACIMQLQLKNLSNKEKDLTLLMLGILKLIKLNEDLLFEFTHKLETVSQIEFAKVINAIRPVLILTDQGFAIRNSNILKELSLPAIDEIAFDCICDLIFERLHRLSDIPQLECAYDLLNLILNAGSVEAAIRFAKDNTIFFLSKKYDYHLLRRIWLFLIEKGRFNVRTLYPDEFSCENNNRSYSKCDIIMKLENSIMIDSEMEAFLDIPTFYSTDIEEYYKGGCSSQEVNAIEELRRLRKNGKLINCVDAMTRFVNRDDLSRDFIAYVYEQLLAYKHEMNLDISKDELEEYFFLAFYRNNLRMTADALRYFGEYVEAFKISTDYYKALSRYRYL